MHINTGRRLGAVILVGIVLASCSSTDDASSTTVAGTEPASTVASTVAATPAGATDLSWDEPAAVGFNGDLPAADPVTVCGASDRRFLGELLQGSPLDYKIPKRLADIRTSPSPVAVSGTVQDPTLGAGDFPFDHTMGSDFNMDVRLDEPFIGVGQESAKPIETVHVELAEGQLPHLAASPAPDQQDWRDMTEAARENFQEGFLPQDGDRVLVMGNWVVDCGHTNFQTEIHPITFMAVARTEGDATVVHTFYNPWRETQLYNPDPSKVIDFERADRMSDPSSKPFPASLIDSILRMGDVGPAPLTSADSLSSWAVLEPNTTSPVDWQVCAPDGTGSTEVGAALLTRPGAEVTISPPSEGCVTVASSVDGVVPGAPSPRTCVTPWDFLSEVATEEAGGEENRSADEGSTGSDASDAPIDLKAELSRFIGEENRAKLDVDPVMNCYEPLAGPDLGQARPSEVDVRSDPDILMPLYGTIVVRRAG